MPLHGHKKWLRTCSVSIVVKMLVWSYAMFLNDINDIIMRVLTTSCLFSLEKCSNQSRNKFSKKIRGRPTKIRSNWLESYLGIVSKVDSPMKMISVCINHGPESG